MDTVVLKFGGSSVADNEKLDIVTDKIKEFYEKNNRVVVVVSAQGKMTDNLLKEAYSLTSMPDERELDVLLSTGEQISMAKVSMLLNKKKIPAISLSGWQAGIITNNTNQNAIIENIDISRIEKELNENKVVVIAGFQGINENQDITTLGRGGSDTTAVAVAAKIKANHCYIFSDVDGVYTTDPKQVETATKIDSLSYDEMLDISDEGAKVLHNRCIEVGEKFNVPIIAKSTFKEGNGTIILNQKIEGITIKNIVKNDKLTYVHLIGEKYSLELFYKIYKEFVDNELGIKNLVNNSNSNLDIFFTIPKERLNKLEYILKTELTNIKADFEDISRLSIIGNGIMSKNNILNEVIEIIEKSNVNILSIETTEAKIAIMFKGILQNEILEKLHKKLIG